MADTIVDTLVVLRLAQQTDRMFMRDLYTHARHLPGRILVVHEATEAAPPEAARFVGKRISAGLSEEMLHNMAMGGDQRGLVTAHDGGVLRVRPEILANLYITLQGVVLSPTAQSAQTLESMPQALAIDPFVRALLDALHPVRVLCFAHNPLSPLGQTPLAITNPEAATDALRVYPEEAAAIAFAQKLGAWLVAPRSFAKLG
jgi:hypothetical protein